MCDLHERYISGQLWQTAIMQEIIGYNVYLPCLPYQNLSRVKRLHWTPELQHRKYSVVVQLVKVENNFKFVHVLFWLFDSHTHSRLYYLVSPYLYNSIELYTVMINTGAHFPPKLVSIGTLSLPTYQPFPPWHSLAVLSDG